MTRPSSVTGKPWRSTRRISTPGTRWGWPTSARTESPKRSRPANGQSRSVPTTCSRTRACPCTTCAQATKPWPRRKRVWPRFSPGAEKSISSKTSRNRSTGSVEHVRRQEIHSSRLQLEHIRRQLDLNLGLVVLAHEPKQVAQIERFHIPNHPRLLDRREFFRLVDGVVEIAKAIDEARIQRLLTRKDAPVGQAVFQIVHLHVAFLRHDANEFFVDFHHHPLHEGLLVLRRFSRGVQDVF